MNLTPGKQAELERALADAAGDVVHRAPSTSMRPLAGGAAAKPPLPLPAAQIADVNLNIVRHKDTGCIQFIFPQPNRPLAPAQALDSWDWVVEAALRAKERMTQAAIEKIEAHSKGEGLRSLSHGFRHSVTKAELEASRGRKVLLFVHGVFSSIEGAFAGLGAAGGMQQLLERYEGQVFGYDHWTIARTPQQNALDLLRRLPPDAGWDLDIVCHSRGGLVVRSLLAERPEADAVLSTIAQQRQGRIGNVGKVFFVAAANQGSPLASPEEIQNFLNVAAMLASFTAGVALDVVIGLARMVVSLGFSRPSVQALASGSVLIDHLDRSDSLLTSADTYYARANFDYGGSALLRTGALLNRLLMDADNDLVVPFNSVLLPAVQAASERMLNFGSAEQKQHEVWHTEFFHHPQTQAFLLKYLA
jgi:pimeloyl-ACP methyl ester carboxylesterase